MNRNYEYKYSTLFKLSIGQLKTQLIKKNIDYDHNYSYTKKELIDKLWHRQQNGVVIVHFGG